ncbi:MAG: hypothetical protein ACJ8C4_15305 [Gemmataceae bacterium]
MLSWSNVKYKMTLGVGSLAIAGMLSELLREVLPVWVALGVGLLPLGVFVFAALETSGKVVSQRITYMTMYGAYFENRCS